MRYAFFDIEAADGNYKICEFGLVICDANMNPVHKKLYLINPQGSFKLTGREGQKDLILSFSEEEYRKAPVFDDIYDNIKFALEQKDLLIFGHSVGNDILFLDKACKRYKLPPIKYKAYDIQKMFSYFGQERRRFASLDKVYETLVPEEEKRDLIEHRSVDDAYMSMLVFKAMLKELEFTPEQMIEVCDGCELDSVEYCKEVLEKEKERNRRRNAKQALHKDGKSDETSFGWSLYREEASKNEGKEYDSELIGKRYAIANRIKDEPDIIEKVIDEIKRRGGYLVFSMGKCDYLIAFDNKNVEALKETFRHEVNFEIITLDNFLPRC